MLLDKRVIVFSSNFKAQRDGLMESGFLRFYGVAELHEDGPIRDAISTTASACESLYRR